MKLLSTDEVVAKVQFSRTTLWRIEKTGHFPARRQVSPKRVGWVAEEVEDWLSSLPKNLIGNKEVSVMLSISVPTLWRIRRRGMFPERRMRWPGDQGGGWFREEVEAWVKSLPRLTVGSNHPLQPFYWDGKSVRSRPEPEGGDGTHGVRRTTRVY